MESTVSNCCQTTRQLLPRSTALNCKDCPTRSARSTRSSTPGARMGSSTAPTVQPSPGPEQIPPLPIASASPGREVLR
ncbi:hypothetical protein RB195_008199 [Necator americanus]|uniref:Uncharacterized protein n=1 Tax=Necator americanus TaxID=51031 RepID=A0ABR1CME8_NECAM